VCRSVQRLTSLLDFHEIPNKVVYKEVLSQHEFREKIVSDTCTLLMGVKEFTSVIFIFLHRYG
jgi:hypothetical protein